MHWCTRKRGLISAVHNVEFYKLLKTSYGFSRVVLQHGSGALPALSDPLPQGLDVQAYAYKPSLKEDFEAASVVISHAGTGCILEALGIDKPLLVIVNQSLMDNHQLELAFELDTEGYLSMGFVDNLVPKFEELMSGSATKKKLWSDKAPATLFSSLITEELGLQ